MRCAVCTTTGASLRRVASFSLFVGPEMPTAPITSPWLLKIVAAMPETPSRHSSLFMAKPFARPAFSARCSSRLDTIVRGVNR